MKALRTQVGVGPRDQGNGSVSGRRILSLADGRDGAGVDAGKE